MFLSRYRGYLTCPDCGGARLRREARAVRVSGRTIDQVSSLTVRTAQEFFGTLALTEKEAAIADKVLKEICRRLSFLSDVGLDYLTTRPAVVDALNRAAKRSASISRRRWDRRWSARCTCSTSHRSVCIRATTCG